MEKKCRDALGQQYARLGGNPPKLEDTKSKKGKKEAEAPMDESVQLLLGDKDYFPYVSYTVNWDPLHKKE